MEPYQEALNGADQKPVPPRSGNDSIHNLVGLSRNDQGVLAVVFNPDKEYSAKDVEEYEQPPPVPPIDELTLSELKQLESQAVKAAEAGNVQSALSIFTECITKCDHYASAYNNRAQVYRLMNDDDKALQDLHKAVHYAGNDHKVLGNAYTQRAAIRKRNGDAESAESDFQMGAKHGNEVAKLFIKSNPFAKMCNLVVSEAMAELRR
ncbi:hypothetical protein SeMB42_g01312 [Synchytrium endobioticum]|uniref:Uncharacterized protein n=1 Tax=Synchytrium endobioticum TaxID=286115 RepID=A0A507DLS8_9FUNG|nr:hypothetical protein SeLEV6574_g03668 [Synchytrium endobioticum]TPX52614.1 hypothetical protein SeMB42_g01312 [Synchytrium endobioticum]